jgi:hypothetical protein
MKYDMKNDTVEGSEKEILAMVSMLKLKKLSSLMRETPVTEKPAKKQKRYPNRHLSWSEEDTAKAWAMNMHKIRISKIARKLGRTKDAVYNRLYNIEHGRIKVKG